MDKSLLDQNPRSRRSNLLMSASLEHADGVEPVTLRNLSAKGALVEGDHRLDVGTRIIFRRRELTASGKVAWLAGRRAGITFDMALDPETVLHHLPVPKPPPVTDCKRPGFHASLSERERRFADTWIWDRPLPSVEK